MNRTNETITRNIPTPALVFVICVTEASKEDAFPIRTETSSVIPLLINLADCAEISEKSPLDILKASVNNPITKEITPSTIIAPARVRTKSLADKGNIVTSGMKSTPLVCCN